MGCSRHAVDVPTWTQYLPTQGRVRIKLVVIIAELSKHHSSNLSAHVPEKSMKRKVVALLLSLANAQALAAEEIAAVGDANGRDWGEAVTTGAALSRACGYAQVLRGPAAEKLNNEEAMLAMICATYAQGVLTAASLAGSFSSPDGSIRFCSPKAGTTAGTLGDAIVASARSAPDLVADRKGTEGVLLLALASVSSCPPEARP